jgi:hypothetical protein
MTEPAKDLTLVGWREYVELPEWGVSRIRVKVDTGARSSAIDVSHLEELPGERVRFEIVPNRKREASRRVIEAKIVRRTKVRSSFGEARDRLFVEAEVRLAGRTLRVEVGLVSRENMLCRMLLGRKSLEHVFVVDPGRTYLHGKRKRKRKKGSRGRT